MRLGTLEAESPRGSGLLLIVCENKVGLETFTHEAGGGDMDRVKRLDDCRHWCSGAFHNGGAQSDFCHNAFQPAKLSSCIGDIVIIPVVF